MWQFDWNIPAYPHGTWVFNPFAWQLLFVFGAWCALGGAQRLSRWIQFAGDVRPGGRLSAVSLFSSP